MIACYTDNVRLSRAGIFFRRHGKSEEGLNRRAKLETMLPVVFILYINRETTAHEISGGFGCLSMFS